jgi:hypothetical protein
MKNKKEKVEYILRVKTVSATLLIDFYSSIICSLFFMYFMA